MSQSITISSPRGGLNNQKLSLFGLYLRCLEDGKKMAVPNDLRDFTPTESDERAKLSGSVPFKDVFCLEKFERFIDSKGVLASGSDIEVVSSDECFKQGAGFLAKISSSSQLDVASSFFLSLKPSNFVENVIKDILESFGDAHVTGVQLRIERDWLRWANIKKLREIPPEKEDVVLTWQEIFLKILNNPRFAHQKSYFACCDEDDLLIPSAEIKGQCLEKFGVEVFFKSQFKSMYSDAGRLINSQIDFELCKKFNSYVGLSRSTFSNLLAFNKSSEDNSPFINHYIYNAPGSAVVERLDYGLKTNPLAVANVGTFN